MLTHQKKPRITNTSKEKYHNHPRWKPFNATEDLTDYQEPNQQTYPICKQNISLFQNKITKLNLHR